MLPHYAFRAYDIRAIYGKDLKDYHGYLIGIAFGRMVLESGRRDVVVCRDGRLSSPTLCDKLIDGLVTTGIHVTYGGVGPSPYAYYCEKKLEPGGAIMITASHNPKDYNGFKILFQGKSLFGQELKNFEKRVRKAFDENLHLVPGKKNDQGRVTHTYLHGAYIGNLVDDFRRHYGEGKSMRIVWDPGNGAACHVIHDLVQLLPGEHHVINGTMDGTFPNHDPDPTDPKNCQQLIEAMKKHQADLGFAFDGDADRLVVVDGDHYQLSGDELLTLFAEEVLKHHPGAPIIGDVKVGEIAWTMIKTWGGDPVMGRTGHALIKTLMSEIKAPLAGEMSGHFFFADRYEGYDDGLYAALRVLGIVSTQGESLATWRSQFPKYFTSPEYRLPCHDKFETMAKIKGQLTRENRSFHDIDGVRVSGDDGWWLIRVAHTQESLSVRLESKTREGYEKLKQDINALLQPAHMVLPE